LKNLYYKPLQICNLQKMGIFCSKPVCFLLSVTFTDLDKHTSLLRNLQCFIDTVPSGLYYKHITIVNDASRIISKLHSKLWHHLLLSFRWYLCSQSCQLCSQRTFIVQASLTIVTYDRQNIFIAQAPNVVCATSIGYKSF